jgi:hypothetical protein
VIALAAYDTRIDSLQGVYASMIVPFGRARGAGILQEEGVVKIMRTEKVKLRVRGLTLVGGVLCAAMVVASAAYAGREPRVEGVLAGGLTMIDPFALQVIVLPEMPPLSEVEDFPASMELHLEQTIRIPDRPLVRSVFKPSP